MLIAMLGKAVLEPSKEIMLFTGQLRELLERGVGLLGLHMITYKGRISAILRVNIKGKVTKDVKVYAYTSDAL